MKVVSGDNWSCKTCKVPVKSSPSTNIQLFLHTGCYSCWPTNSVKALRKVSHSMHLLTARSPGIFLPCHWLLRAPGYRKSVAKPVIDPLTQVPKPDNWIDCVTYKSRNFNIQNQNLQYISVELRTHTWPAIIITSCTDNAQQWTTDERKWRGKARIDNIYKEEATTEFIVGFNADQIT